MKRRIIALILALLLLIGTVPTVLADQVDWNEARNRVLSYIASTVQQPTCGSVGGEWSVLALARGGYYPTDSRYFEDYYARIVQTVSASEDGKLHRSKSTENSRVILALSAIGKDARNAGGVDLTAPYSDFSWVKKQGVNGPVFALLALDAVGGDMGVRQQCIDFLLQNRLADGGWALSGSTADPDVTAMAMQALAAHSSDRQVDSVLNAAVLCLSGMQTESGGFSAWGSENAESIAQVIVALSALGIDADTDSRFIKNGRSALDALLSYYDAQTGGFAHVLTSGGGYTGGAVNAMATDQAAYALVAYDRMKAGQVSLYDMQEEAPVALMMQEIMEEPHQPLPEQTYGTENVFTPEIVFSDVKPSDWFFEDVSFVTRTGLFQGTSPNSFCPDRTMTRAMLVTVLYRLAGQPPVRSRSRFSDVSAGSWYANAVAWASANSIVTGTGDQTFSPDADLTREQLAAILYRYAAYSGRYLQNTASLSAYRDSAEISAYARDAFVWAVGSGLIGGSNARLMPLGSATRAQVAAILHRFVMLP